MTEIKKKGTGKAGKLQLHKETIKDLSDKSGQVKGGLGANTAACARPYTGLDTKVNCCAAHA